MERFHVESSSADIKSTPARARARVVVAAAPAKRRFGSLFIAPRRRRRRRQRDNFSRARRKVIVMPCRSVDRPPTVQTCALTRSLGCVNPHMHRDEIFSTELSRSHSRFHGEYSCILSSTAKFHPSSSRKETIGYKYLVVSAFLSHSLFSVLKSVWRRRRQ